MMNTNPQLPNMSETIKSWFLNLTFEIVERIQVGADFKVDWATKQEISVRGVVQPPSDKDLKILPEGSWAWEWLMVHCLPDAQIEVNQFVRYDGIVYKVMKKKDWSKYGYVRYYLLEAFRAEEAGAGV